MAQGVLSFKYEEEKKDFGSTSTAGLLLFLDLFYKMDFIKMVNRHLEAKMNKQGWSDFYFLLSLMLLNICGGDCVDDIKIMEKDDGLCRVMKNLELRNTWGRHRQKLKRQWRNGKKNVFPSPSAIFRYLLLFHNASEEKNRKKGEAFIPASNNYLSSLCSINKDMLEYLQLNRPQPVATIDMDATLIESNKEEALFCYKKFKGYQPMNAWWWEHGYMIHTEFRDGNVGAGVDQKRVFIETLSCLPDGVEKVYLRSDSAGYQHDLMRYCELGKNDRFGRIEFAICCDIYGGFKNAVYEVEEEDWKKIYKEVKENGELKLKWTGQEWAEVCYVPEDIGRSKNDPDYRYIAIRELVKQKELEGIVDEAELQKSFSFPNVKINNNRYKISGIVTNLCWDGEKIIHWQRQRCGYSEHVHSEMKEAFCGGSLPSGKFGSNAAWWWIMVLALNLTVLLKSLVLDKNWKTSRMKRIRYWLINVPGRVILKGKDLVVRLTRDHPAFGLLVDARRRIAILGLDAFGDTAPAPG